MFASAVESPFLTPLNGLDVVVRCFDEAADFMRGFLPASGYGSTQPSGLVHGSLLGTSCTPRLCGNVLAAATAGAAFAAASTDAALDNTAAAPAFAGSVWPP